MTQSYWMALPQAVRHWNHDQLLLFIRRTLPSLRLPPGYISTTDLRVYALQSIARKLETRRLLRGYASFRTWYLASEGTPEALTLPTWHEDKIRGAYHENLMLLTVAKNN